jgi:hypothetical protein
LVRSSPTNDGHADGPRLSGETISSPPAHNIHLDIAELPTRIRAIAGHNKLLFNPMWGGAVSTRRGATGLVFYPMNPVKDYQECAAVDEANR